MTGFAPQRNWGERWLGGRSQEERWRTVDFINKTTKKKRKKMEEKNNYMEAYETGSVENGMLEFLRNIKKIIIREGGARYVGLWNRNVEYAEDDEPWETTAVFVEFGAMNDMQTKELGRTRFDGTVRLHVVTNSAMGDMYALTKLWDIASIMRDCRIEGRNYGYTLDSIHANHDHGELVEGVLEYGFRFCAE